MRLKDSAPEPAGYRIRSAPDSPERGPYTLDQLKDLAEFGNIAPEWLVQKPGETEYQPLTAFPDLLNAVFPPKKSFQFKQYQAAENPDAGYEAIDVKDIYRCKTELPPKEDRETAAPKTPNLLLRPTKLSAPTPPPAPAAFQTDPVDVKALLERNISATRKRPSPAEPPRVSSQPTSASRIFFVTRWVIAAILLILGIHFLVASGSWRIAVPLFGLAFFLVALDLIGWIANAPEYWINRSIGNPANFTRAETHLEAGNWSAAASAYLAETKRHPKEIAGYVPGISAAIAAREPKTVSAFHSLARKNLGAHDLNLLNGALQRRNLAPVAET